MAMHDEFLEGVVLFLILNRSTSPPGLYSWMATISYLISQPDRTGNQTLQEDTRHDRTLVSIWTEEAFAIEMDEMRRG